MTDENTATAEMTVTSMTAATLGKDLLGGMLNELRSMPDHWARLTEQQQEQSLARMRDSVRAMVTEAMRVLVRGSFASVNVTIESINIKGETKINLEMAEGDPNRHALYDAKGRTAMLVLISSEEFMQRMEEVQAQSDQADLFGGDYDPSRDQPGYRRDEAPSAPAGMSWAELRAKYNIKDKYEPEEATEQIKATDDAYAEMFKSIYGKAPSELTEVEAVSEEVERVRQECLRRMTDAAAPAEDAGPVEATDDQHELLKQLRSVYVYLTLTEVQGFTPQQVAVTREWADAYAEDADKCKIARPFFLPVPDPSRGEPEAPAEG